MKKIIFSRPFLLGLGSVLLGLQLLIASPARANGTDQIFLDGRYYATVQDGTDVAAFMRSQGINVRYDRWDGHSEIHYVSRVGGGTSSTTVVTQQQTIIIHQPVPTYPTTSYPATTHRVDDVYVNGRYWGTVPENSDVCRQVSGDCSYSHFNQAASANGVHYVTTGHGQTQVRRHDQGDDVFCLGGRSGSVAGILCF